MLLFLPLPLLLLAVVVDVDASEEMILDESPTSTPTPPPQLPVFPTIDSNHNNNNQTAPAMSMMLMPEGKRAPDPPMWSPSPPDLTPMMMHHQPTMPAQSAPVVAAPIMPQAVYPSTAAVAHSPPPPPQQPLQQPMPQPQQPFVPANYYLAADEYPGNQYGPPISSNEYRSEHYSSYPPFESAHQPSYPIQVQQQQPQQQIDTSLIPTAKHFVLVSFIGLLLLFSIIQNSIAATRRKDALVEVLSNRKKRDIVALTSLQRMTPEVESALKEDARIRCIQRTLCYENRKLHEDLGIVGKLLAKYLTRNVRSSLKDLSPGWDRLVEDAANAGLRGEDCDVLYRDCSSEFSTETEVLEEEEQEEEEDDDE